MSRTTGNPLLMLMSKPRVYCFLHRLPPVADTKERIIRKEMQVLEGERVLDLGCGPGNRSVLFPQDSYLGIDIDEEAIAFAQRNYPGEFKVMDALQLELGDSSIDWILASGFLHHLSDTDALVALKEARRVLNPSGKMLAMASVWPVHKLNLWGWMIRRMDRGPYVRTGDDCARLFGVHFDVERRYPFRVLWLDSATFLLRPKR